MALAYSKTEQRLYVSDAKNRKIWAFDCTDRCAKPATFLESDALENPTTLAVALDGTIWLGDLRGQTLTAIAPDGTVENTIYSLSGLHSAPGTETTR